MVARVSADRDQLPGGVKYMALDVSCRTTRPCFAKSYGATFVANLANQPIRAGPLRDPAHRVVEVSDCTCIGGRRLPTCTRRRVRKIGRPYQAAHVIGRSAGD